MALDNDAWQITLQTTGGLGGHISMRNMNTHLPDVPTAV